MKQVEHKDVLSFVKNEIEKKEKKQLLLDEVNKKLKLLGRVLNYKGNHDVSKYFRNDGFTKVERFLHKKPKARIHDIYEWTYDISYFTKRIKNMPVQQRNLFYQYAFGNVSTKVPEHFIRDVTEYTKLASKNNTNTLENLMKIKYFIRITTSLSMMFHSYYKLQAKQKELQQELVEPTTLGELKRLVKKLEHAEQCYFTEKDKRILLSFNFRHKKILKQLETFFNQHNNEWLHSQEKKKEILSKIKKLEVNHHTVQKDNIVLVTEDVPFDEIIPVEYEEEQENVYVTNLFQLLKLEPNLESLESYLPTIEFKDYYLLRDGLLEKVEEEIQELKQAKKETNDVEEQGYLEEELLHLHQMIEYLKQYFHDQETEKQLETNDTALENEIIYLLQPSGVPFIIKDMKNQLEKEQIPYFIKALNRIKQGTDDFDSRKLNKFKDGKGYFGANDVFEAKAGQIRILFQYLGDHKIAVFMYFNKKSNHTTTLLREMMKERITHCEEQVETLREEIANNTLNPIILEQSYQIEQDLLEKLELQDKKGKKNYSLR